MRQSSGSDTKPKAAYRKSKVKSGCRTCKTRKVKCDEGRPACKRCVTTGRVCDGYGIWGGGGNHYADRSDKRQSSLVLQPKTPAPLGPGTVDQEHRFEWFLCRTTLKLPGGFVSGFWKVLVLQASLAEPAVLHAALALSAAHQNEPYKGIRDRGDASVILDPEERFVLTHYTKAISHLQPHLAVTEKSSLRVALITCLLFTCTEFLRGHYVSGISHLHNGIKVLETFKFAPKSTGTTPPPSWNFSDYWIVETFARLYIGSCLFGQSFPGHCPVIPDWTVGFPDVMFHNIGQARHSLDWLLEETLVLEQQARNTRTAFSDEDLHLVDFTERKEHVKSNFESWKRTYEIASANFDTQDTFLDPLAHKLLQAYYPMVEIMAARCTESCELNYDAHVGGFLAILARALANFKIGRSHALAKALNEQGMSLSRSISDMGSIPSLYYVALKCRVRRIRHHALKLLALCSHKEGIWDAKIVTKVAREVVRIEEDGFYQNHMLSDDFDDYSLPTEEEIVLPTLPESQRVNHVQVTFPDDTSGSLVLECLRKRDDGGWYVLTRIFDPIAQMWKSPRDVKGFNPLSQV
ncbi:hypothetical protein JX266_007940 [Neoarthrinium moseri]|nr:hypothetical protein JX266_007940 [Neoarthrinium moseri]